MKNLGVNEIRELFLQFFESKDHLRLKSFSVVPRNDKSLLLINSGMAPMKAYFTGQETPPSKRVTTCQKCIRTGDIDNVGKTARHGTFFEMLGDFSFGDYFKNEIIPWSWEFVTKWLEIPEDKLYVTIYEEDDETGEIWHEKVGLPWDRIKKLGKEDNFWQHGTGPCGPCTEIYYDRGPEYGCNSPTCGVGCDCDRYMEFWNLVLTQFDAHEDGTYTELEHKNVDTGMGLERMATIMQGVDSIFDVDTVKYIRDVVCQKAGVEYGKEHKIDVSVRIITDHIRSVTIMTADGVLPSNEGRGYVLRRLLRRAARHGKLLGIQGEFLAELSKAVITCSGEAYPELVDKQDYIFKILSIEENSFYKTIDKGMEILKEDMEEMKAAGETVMSGEKSFRLYDTYGFPVDLTKEILEEAGMRVDEEAFAKEMQAQKDRARKARGGEGYMGAAVTVYDELPTDLETKFAGYDVDTVADAKIVALVANDAVADGAQAEDSVVVFLDRTPFYAESGGQVGDHGIIKTANGVVKVTNCMKVIGGKIAHQGVVEEGSVTVGDIACAEIDKKHRMASARNHSATHLLQKALRTVLGTHVEQSGSYVSADRLRFDFTHFSPMTNEELAEVEKEVNRQIMKNVDLEIEEMPVDDAIKKGAMALFGEKYGDIVRVVNVPGFSCELCGGSHVSNTSVIGSFRIVGESGTGTGIRRIEAVTGKAAHELAVADAVLLQEAATLLKSKEADIPAKIEQLLTALKEAEREVAQLSHKLATSSLDDILAAKEEIHGVSVTAASVTVDSAEGLRDMADMVLDKVGGIVLLGAVQGDKVSFVCKVDKELTKQGYHAGKIVKAAAVAAGGGGGGRPDMAQAGGKDPQKLEEALKAGKEAVQGAGK